VCVCACVVYERERECGMCAGGVCVCVCVCVRYDVIQLIIITFLLPFLINIFLFFFVAKSPFLLHYATSRTQCKHYN
jgi:hypothetical protein